nr:hypothetical protein GCM10020093_020830 [Planobispora longispora]
MLSALLAAFMHVLARSRRYALDLVARKTEQLRYQATHDALTGLPNRALILEQVGQALDDCQQPDTAIAIMFLDLDGFKNVNDTFGHAAGDRLLRAVAQRVTGVLRDESTVGGSAETSS